MAVGDKKVLVTQAYVDETFDRKDNITDNVNLYDSTKKASAKAVAHIEDRIELLESAFSSLVGSSYTLPVATSTELGGVKIGQGLNISDGVLSSDTQSSGGITQIRKKYIASEYQTTFLATYSIGYIDVFLNGIKLDESDFTADNGINIVLESGCLADDVVQIISYSAINVLDTYTQAQIDDKIGAINVLDTYTQAQIDDKIGDIASMLDIINGTVI